MYISGSIGITILKNLKNKKRIVLLADDHSKKVYCDDKTLDQHYEIKEFLENELENGIKADATIDVAVEDKEENLVSETTKTLSFSNLIEEFENEQLKKQLLHKVELFLYYLL